MAFFIAFWSKNMLKFKIVFHLSFKKSWLRQGHDVNLLISCNFSYFNRLFGPSPIGVNLVYTNGRVISVVIIIIKITRLASYIITRAHPSYARARGITYAISFVREHRASVTNSAFAGFQRSHNIIIALYTSYWYRDSGLSIFFLCPPGQLNNVYIILSYIKQYRILGYVCNESKEKRLEAAATILSM